MSDEHHHGADHDHGHGSHGSHGSHGPWARIKHILGLHSHTHDSGVDEVLQSCAEGMRTLWISLAGLGATALAQVAVVALSGSIALLGDALHNSADALTAVPLGLAFMLSRRRPDRRYTYGYGRAEDIAGLVVAIAVVGWQAAREVGRSLRAECEILVDPDSSLVQAHDVAVSAEHGLIHAIPRLTAAVVHADPLDDTDHHALLADHSAA
jgi:divalent metal cation (Fe/Co/Zn/Cd) transporter